MAKGITDIDPVPWELRGKVLRDTFEKPPVQTACVCWGEVRLELHSWEDTGRGWENLLSFNRRYKGKPSQALYVDVSKRGSGLSGLRGLCSAQTESIIDLKDDTLQILDILKVHDVEKYISPIGGQNERDATSTLLAFRGEEPEPRNLEGRFFKQLPTRSRVALLKNPLIAAIASFLGERGQ